MILSTNTLVGVQSIMMKEESLTGMYYDYALAAPFMAGLSEKGNEDRDTPDLEAANVVSSTELITLNGTPGNFVFVGRGWGHGVGMSQYGAKDLAELGYDYDVILRTYYVGTELKHFTEIYTRREYPQA